MLTNTTLPKHTATKRLDKIQVHTQREINHTDMGDKTREGANKMIIHFNRYASKFDSLYKNKRGLGSTHALQKTCIMIMIHNFNIIHKRQMKLLFS